MISASATTTRKSSSPTTTAKSSANITPCSATQRRIPRPARHAGALLHHARRRPFLAGGMVPRLAPRTGDAHVRPQQKQTEEEYAGRTHAAGRGRLGAAAQRTETRRTRGLHLTDLRYLLKQDPPKAKGGSSSIQTPGPHPHALRQGRSRICARREVALLGQRRLHRTGCAAATSR